MDRFLVQLAQEFMISIKYLQTEDALKNQKTRENHFKKVHGIIKKPLPLTANIYKMLLYALVNTSKG